MRKAPMTRVAAALAVLGMLAGSAGSALALINPNFTPKELVSQSETILKVNLTVDAEGKALQAKVVEALKGAKPGDVVKIDLTAGAMKEQAKGLAEMVRAAGKNGMDGLIFVGNYEEQADFGADVAGGFDFEGGGMGGGGAASEFAEAYLHLGQFRWMALYKAKGGGLEFEKTDSHMEATWAGSTPMLDRMVRYVISDPDPHVPVNTEVHWDYHKLSAKGLTGTVDMRAVPLGDGLAQTLWIARTDGDRLFAFDQKAGDLVDVTAKKKLSAKSSQGVWGDFNKDGRADLLSWDGAKLTVHLQAADGTFAASEAKVSGQLGDVVGLTVCDTNMDGQADVLVSTSGYPVLLVNDTLTFSARPLGEGKPTLIEIPADAAKRGWKQLASRCMVADFDGDSWPDVVQMFSLGGFFYKGSADGFAKAEAIDASLGQNPAADPVATDLDGDELPDIFVASEDAVRIWHNVGGAKFQETLQNSGEIAYISKGTGIGVDVGDVNNDGRQDVLIAYSSMRPQIFFNRGYRSTGHSHELDLHEKDLIPQAGEHGLSAGCLGDFNGDGAQDMAFVVAKVGELFTFYRKAAEEDPTRGVLVKLDATGGYAGPPNVVGYQEAR